MEEGKEKIIVPAAQNQEKETVPPAIRTMKSDVEEMFQKTRPSLGQIIGRGLEESKTRTEKEETQKYLLLIGVSVVLIILAGAATLWLIQANRPTSEVKEIAPPPPFFAVEKSSAFTVKPEEPGEFLRSLNLEIMAIQAEGTIKNILVKVDSPAETHYLSLADFLSFLRVEPRPDLFAISNNPLMFFSYATPAGPRLGFAVKTKDPERMLRFFLLREPTLQRDFQTLLLDENPPLASIPFEDRSFRNIDWRYLKLTAEKDLGLVYAIFPTGNLFIFATSRQEMETIINRLFDSR